LTSKRQKFCDGFFFFENKKLNDNESESLVKKVLTEFKPAENRIAATRLREAQHHWV